MFINKVLNYIHKYTADLYNNSIILQNLDNIIFVCILATFILSTFVNSDIIGYFGLIVFILTLVKAMFKPNETFKCEKFEIFLIAYFMLVLISLAGSTLFMLSLKGFLKTFIYLGFYVSVVHHLKDNKKHILPIIITIAGCICAEALVGLGQSFSKVDEISGWQDMTNLNPEEVITRVYGTLQPLNPNLLGGYFVMAISSIYGLFAYTFYKKQYILTGITGLLSALCTSILFLTGCRGAYIALFGIFLTIFILSLKLFWNKYKKIYITVTTLLSSFIAFAICAVTPLRVRVLSIFAMRNDSSNSFRFNVYKSSIQMFKDNWTIGIGQGNQNFREIYGLYMKTGFDALSSYNIYLETAVESGIFALFAFLGFLFCLIYDSVKYIRQNTDTEQLIFVTIPLLTIIGTMIHGMVDTVFFRPQLQIVFWTNCAILSTLLYPQKES